MVAETTKTSVPEQTMKKVVATLSPEAHEGLNWLVQTTHRSQSDLVRTGLALVRLLVDSKAQGLTLAVIDREDQVKHRIVLV